MQFLDTTPVRRRVLGLLKDHADTYREISRTDARGDVERSILLRGIRPSLGLDPVDRLIADVIVGAESSEEAAGLFQQTFEGLIWDLNTGEAGQSRIRSLETIVSNYEYSYTTPNRHCNVWMLKGVAPQKTRYKTTSPWRKLLNLKANWNSDGEAKSRRG